MLCTVGLNRSLFAHIVIPGPSPVNAYREILEIVQVSQQFQKSDYPLWFVQIWWFKAWIGKHKQLWDNL